MAAGLMCRFFSLLTTPPNTQGMRGYRQTLVSGFNGLPVSRDYRPLIYDTTYPTPLTSEYYQKPGNLSSTKLKIS